MRLLLSALFIISGILLLQSCQKEINFATGNPSVTGEFKAKIDGTPWTANKISGASRFSGLINLTGVSLDKKTLTITLTDSGVHRYILDDMSMNAAAYIDSNLTDPSAFTTNQGTLPGQAGGEVNITSIDTVNKKMSGTFSFKVYRQSDGLQRDFTEGTFTNISYAISLPPASTTDTFRVKIDGVQWIPPSILSAAAGPSIAINGNNLTVSKTVAIICPVTIIPGTYTLDFFSGTHIGVYNPDADPTHSRASTSGTLTILEHNPATKRIRGTFNFHAEELLNPAAFSELTEGYFSVRYF